MTAERQEVSREQPHYVTKVVERKPQYRGGVTFELPFLQINENDRAWFLSIGGKTRITLPSFKSPGTAAYYKMIDALSVGDRSTVESLLPIVQEGSIKSFDDKTKREKWSHLAVQVPEWGTSGTRSRQLKQTLTARATGNVLEAMSGFLSHIDASSSIGEVIAMDFCEEALERYDYPDRKRILFDFERVAHGEKIPFFPDGSFQTVAVTFGMDYLSDVDPVYGEFNRLLSPGGKVLVVGGTLSGYEELLERNFDPMFHEDHLRETGFIPSTMPLPFLHEQGGFSDYYVVEGTKQ